MAPAQPESWGPAFPWSAWPGSPTTPFCGQELPTGGLRAAAGEFDLTERALVTHCLGTWCTDGRPPRIVTVALTVLAGNFALKRRGCPACRQPVGACRSWTAGERKASLNASGRAAHVRRTGNSWPVAMRPRRSVQRIEWRTISKSGTCQAWRMLYAPEWPGGRKRSRIPSLVGLISASAGRWPMPELRHWEDCSCTKCSVRWVCGCFDFDNVVKRRPYQRLSA